MTILLLLAIPLQATPVETVETDVAYLPGAVAAQTLDVYGFEPSDDEAAGRAVMIYVHGGGWSRGDKRAVRAKPAFFNGEEMVFVSVNYRLHPATDIGGQASDIASAIAWAKKHAAAFGGDGDRLFLMGHSAGAHLAALVAADPRYLDHVKLAPGDLAGVVLLDSAAYDVPAQYERSGGAALYDTVFSSDLAKQRLASPTLMLAADPMPPTLLVHVAGRDDSRLAATGLADAIRRRGGTASVLAAANKNHATLNHDLGTPGDPVTRRVRRFLLACELIRE